MAFALAYTQAPDFWSNQHQYFLHGLAAAGVGDLRHDWLANTADPTPVFSGAVALIAHVLPLASFRLAYLVLLGVYFRACTRLLDAIAGVNRPGRFLGLAVLIVIHSAGLRYASVLILGKDYAWFAQAGLAGQYLLGPGLQPSVFGIFILLGLVAWLEGRPMHAAGWIAFSALIHATYMLPAATFVAALLAQSVARAQFRQAVGMAAVVLGVVAPAVAYVGCIFLTGDSEQRRAAEELLYTLRIPHHCQIDRAMDGPAVVQLMVIIVALFALRRTGLGRLLIGVAVASFALSVLQLVTQSHGLALLFPWRTSVVLMPVATAVLVDRASTVLVSGGGVRLAQGVGVAGVSVAVTAAGYIVLGGIGYFTNPAEAGVLRFVRETRRPGDVYLFPVHIPNLAAGPRGSVSMTFQRPPRVAAGLIPLDFQGFRLSTGAAAFIDFKSIPYRPDEVLEWHRRLLAVQAWFQADDWTGQIRDLQKAGVTHLLIPTGRADKGLPATLYTDEHYRVYTLTRN